MPSTMHLLIYLYMYACLLRKALTKVALKLANLPSLSSEKLSVAVIPFVL